MGAEIIRNLGVKGWGQLLRLTEEVSDRGRKNGLQLGAAFGAFQEIACGGKQKKLEVDFGVITAEARKQVWSGAAPSPPFRMHRIACSVFLPGNPFSKFL